MLNADTATPNTYSHMGSFGDILHNVLTAAAFRVAPDVVLKHTVFDVVQGEYPSSPSDYDAFVITASAASAFDGACWVRKLEDYVVRLHEEHPGVRLFGSCFGHHTICQALLKQHGVRVEKHPRGWEIGVSDVYLTDEFRNALGSCEQKITPLSFNPTHGRLPTPEAELEHCDNTALLPGPRHQIPRSLRLQFVHEDQVVMDCPHTSLPSPWTILGFTDHCAIQGVYRPGRILTLQGHFEFDKFKSRETMRMFGAENEVEGGSEFCQASTSHHGESKGRPEDDGELVAEMVLRFLVGSRSETEEYGGPRQTDITDGDLPTPRSSLEI